jgi:hypothetical protein
MRGGLLRGARRIRPSRYGDGPERRRANFVPHLVRQESALQRSEAHTPAFACSGGWSALVDLFESLDFACNALAGTHEALLRGRLRVLENTDDRTQATQDRNAEDEQDADPKRGQGATFTYRQCLAR